MSTSLGSGLSHLTGWRPATRILPNLMDGARDDAQGSLEKVSWAQPRDLAGVLYLF